MYQLITTAGLNTSAPTIDTAAAVLAQHLHDTAPAGVLHWKITTPRGSVHAGHVNRPSAAFLAETVEEIAGNLQHEINAADAPTAAPEPDETLRIRVQLDLDLDAESWRTEYGLAHDTVAEDARSHLVEHVREVVTDRATAFGTFTVAAAAGAIVSPAGRS